MRKAHTRLTSVGLVFYMQLLNFDEINKATDVKEWLLSLKPSELMQPENRKRCEDLIWDLMEYLYVLGFKDAREDLGVVAEEMATFLPPDYMERKDEAMNKEYDGLNFTDRVREYAELGDVPSIIRVVETDGHRIYESGGLSGAWGIGHTKTWHTMEDERVRDTHEYIDGMTVGIDEAFFTYDGDSAQFPGDFSLPQNSINCRCFLTYNR